MKLQWSTRARRELQAIAAYIARDDRNAAAAWTARLKRRAELAAVAPHGGRVVPEYRRHDIREVFVRSYRIIYRIAGTAIWIVTVLEGHQRLPEDVDPDA